MKKFTKILILSIFTILMIGSFTKSVFAVTPSIEFEASPLFGESNFIPGQSVTRTIKFTNNTDIVRSSYIRVAEVINTDKFGDAVTLVIKQGNTIIYNDTFSNFFKKGKVNLPQVKVGDTNIISLIATFIPESNNDYQNKVMGFGLQAILEDVEESNDHTTVIGGSGGVTVGSKHLVITDENAVSINPTEGDINVTWNTNIPATSQVIYGLTSGGPYTLDLTAFNFGYPFSTIETDLDNNKITNHGVIINSLIPGETYVYRVVSRASPATVSYEHEFTVSLLAIAPLNDGLVLGANTENNKQGDVLGASTENIPEGSDTPMGNVLGASVFNSGLDMIWSSCYLFSLIILIIIYLIWRFWLKRKYEKQGMTKEKIVNKFCIFFGISSLLISIILLIIGKYCPVIIFVIAFIISAGFYAYMKLTR